MKILREANAKKYNIDDVIEEICYHYNVTEEDILSRKRSASLVEPRQMIMYIARKHLYMPYQDIANKLKRNHATVLYAFNKLDYGMLPAEKKIYRRAVNSLSRNNKQVNMQYRMFAALGRAYPETLKSDFVWSLRELPGKQLRHFNVIYTEV